MNLCHGPSPKPPSRAQPPRWHSTKLQCARGGSSKFVIFAAVRNAPERSWHASGPIFSPNRRFWTRFGPFLMIWARTHILGGTWPGQGLAGRPWDQPRDWPGGLAQPILFFSHEIKQNYFVSFPRARAKGSCFLRLPLGVWIELRDPSRRMKNQQKTAFFFSTFST